MLCSLHIWNLMHFYCVAVCIQRHENRSVVLSSTNKHTLMVEWKTGQSSNVSSVKVMTKMWNEYKDRWQVKLIHQGNIPAIYIMHKMFAFEIFIKIYFNCCLPLSPLFVMNMIHHTWPWYASVYVYSILYKTDTLICFINLQNTLGISDNCNDKNQWETAIIQNA